MKTTTCTILRQSGVRWQKNTTKPCANTLTTGTISEGRLKFSCTTASYAQDGNQASSFLNTTSNAWCKQLASILTGGKNKDITLCFTRHKNVKRKSVHVDLIARFITLTEIKELLAIYRSKMLKKNFNHITENHQLWNLTFTWFVMSITWSKLSWTVLSGGPKNYKKILWLSIWSNVSTHKLFTITCSY